MRPPHFLETNKPMKKSSYVLGGICAIALGATGLRCGDDDGKVLVRVVNESNGSNCANGGFQIQTGADDNDNNTLEDDEVDGRSYACNGEPTPAPNLCELKPYGRCTNADLRGVSFYGDSDNDFFSRYRNMDFTGSDLRGAMFVQVDFQSAIFANAKLDGVFAVETNFALADFTGASAKKVNWLGSIFSGATFVGTDFSEGFFISNAASGSDFTRAKFTKGYFAAQVFKTNFTETDFTDAVVGTQFRLSNLTNANFTGADLRDARFDASAEEANVLTGANFSFATLLGTNFTDVNFTGIGAFANAYYDATTTGLTGPDLSTAINFTTAGNSLQDKDFRRMWISSSDVSFAGKNLTNSNFDGAHFQNQTFAGANLTGAHLTNVTLRSSDFAGATATGADFTNSYLDSLGLSAPADFSGANFTRASLRDTNFGTSNVSGANFSHATLFGANLGTVGLTPNAPAWAGAFTRGTTLPAGASGTVAVENDASLAGANLQGIKLQNDSFTTATNFSGADFTDATIVNTTFGGADLSGAKFVNADATGTDFQESNMTNADFTGADLTRSDLTNVNLTGANMTNTTLLCIASGIGYTDIGIPNFSNVTWSGTTCPDGIVIGETTDTSCVRHLLNTDLTDSYTSAFCNGGIL